MPGTETPQLAVDSTTASNLRPHNLQVTLLRFGNISRHIACQSKTGLSHILDIYVGREVRLYEAADLHLSNHIAEKSVTVQFVNARLPSKCSRMLKKMSDLRKLNEIDPDGEDVFVPTLIEDHYPARPESLNDMCLYDFVKHIDWNHKNHKNEKTFRRLQKPRDPNHPQFDPERPDQTEDYYYSLVLTFVPFRDECELLLTDETPERPTVTLSLTMNTSYNLTRTQTLLTSKHESPCSMLTRGACTTRSLVTSFTCKNMRNKSVHAQS